MKETTAIGPRSKAMRIRAEARAALPQGDQTTPLPADWLEDVRTEHGRGVANLVEFPWWLLTGEAS